MKQLQNELNGKHLNMIGRCFRLGLLPLFIVGVWAGCKQDPKIAADTKISGTYTLVSVDGNKVPCAVEHEGHKLAIKTGTFIINPDGTCSSKVVFGPPSGGDMSREVKASYTQQGSKLSMKWEGAGRTAGVVEADMFSMNNEGMSFVYRK